MNQKKLEARIAGASDATKNLLTIMHEEMEH